MSSRPAWLYTKTLFLTQTTKSEFNKGTVHEARGMPITLVLLCYLYYAMCYTCIDVTWYPMSLYNYYVSNKIPKEELSVGGKVQVLPLKLSVVG